MAGGVVATPKGCTSIHTPGATVKAPLVLGFALNVAANVSRHRLRDRSTGIAAVAEYGSARRCATAALMSGSLIKICDMRFPFRDK
jgi:hypothetical protein